MFTSLYLLSFSLSLLFSLTSSVTPTVNSSIPFSLRNSCLATTCSQCDDCPRQKLHAEVENCKLSLQHLQLYFEGPPPPSINLTRDCSFTSCYPSQRLKNCDLLPRHLNNHQFFYHLTSAINRKSKQLKQLKKHRASLININIVRPGLQAYHDRLTLFNDVIRKQSHDAFNAQAYNHQLRQYRQSYQYRQQRQQVLRKHHENDVLRSHYKFWQHQQKTLSQVVKLSPAAVQRARDDLQKRMRQYQADVRLMDVVTEAAGTKEEQVKLVTEMKLELQRRIDNIRDVHAHAKAELGFIEKARHEIAQLLTAVLDGIREQKGGVTCGGGAMGKVITNALIESQ